MEAVVATTDELKVGEMKEAKVGDVTILVANTSEGWKASGNKCTHYGAKLCTGVLQGDRVVCPWHGAGFSMSSGDIEEAPALQPIATYSVRVEGKQVIATVPQDVSASVPVGTCDPADARVFLIVGGGAAGMSAAQTLRKVGYKGRVVLACGEAHHPYDKIKLNKNPTVVATNFSSILLQPEDYFKAANIEVLLGHKAAAVDTTAKTVRFENGVTLQYDEMLACTGMDARKLPVQGFDLRNVFTIRVPEDSKAIVAKVESDTVSKAVVVGSGFIGMENAAWMIGQGITDITVVDMLDGPPMARVFGPEIGEHLRKLHESKGIKFMMGSGLDHFEGKDAVEAVILKNGTRLEADLVIVGAGATLNTDWLKTDSKIELTERGEVVVDRHMRNSSGIYAAGDIAKFPYPLADYKEQVRIEHWNVAQQHGRVAASNMAGKQRVYDSCPYFWTVQYGSVRYCGHAVGWDEIVYPAGDLSTAGKTVAYFVKGNTITAVASIGMDPYVSLASELFRQNRMPTADQIKGGLDLLTL